MLDPYFYILDGKKPKAVDNVIEWAKWIETADRTVARTELPYGVLVSTVFLTIPVVWTNRQQYFFETLVIDGDHDGYRKRYFTWEEAEAGHQKTIEMIFEV